MRSVRDKYIVLFAVCLASVVLPLDFSGAAAATPAIARALRGSPTAVTWIVNSFMLAFGSTVMAAGALADVYGRKRIFAIGIASFVATSVAVSFAPSVAWLDAFRVGQGLAAACTLSGGSAALAQEFDGPERARAFSLLGTTFGLGLAFGPSLGGVLLGVLGWRSVFLSGAIVGVVSLAFAIPTMRESRDPNARGVDGPGTATFTAALALFTFALIEAPARGWTSLPVLGLFGAAALALVAFVQIERHAAHPMLDLSLFRYPRFVGVQALPIATACCYVVLLILLPIRFIGIEGHDEVTAGTTMLALSAPMLVVPFAVATCTRWISPGTLSAAGLVLAAGGLVWLGRIAPGAPVATMAKPMLLIGFGTSAPWGLMDGLSVSVVPKERAGMATGIFGTTRIAGESIALAATRAALATMIGARIPHPEMAQSVAAGDLLHAGGDSAIMLFAYGDAFRMLCNGLAVLTLASALVVLVFLSGASLVDEKARRDEIDEHPNLG
ncbi:MFS transporter [Pendulispora rubella]|uniref:MFS transporter n=1 Tax=Pendulispora rubella TaxID=2741070 RepID=A0ABZ2LAY7_9BACT